MLCMYYIWSIASSSYNIWQAPALSWPFPSHVAHSVTVYTNMKLLETTILMLLCIGEYSVTNYLGNINKIYMRLIGVHEMHGRMHPN